MYFTLKAHLKSNTSSAVVLHTPPGGRDGRPEREGGQTHCCRSACCPYNQLLLFFSRELHNQTLMLGRQVHYPVHVWNYAVAQNTFSFPFTFLSFTHPQSQPSNFHLLLQPPMNMQTPVFLPKHFLPLHSPSSQYKPLTT